MPSGEFRQVSSEDSRCEALAESLSAYVDGALTETLKQDVEAHLRACTTCAAELARLQTLCAELRDLVAVAPPALVWDKVRDAASAGRGEGTGARKQNRVLARLAEIVLFLFDGDLARRCRVEGTCRERAGVHGVIAVVTGLVLALLPLGLAASAPSASIAAGLVFLWLASTRLEGRLSHAGLVATILAGSAAPAALELTRAMTGLIATPPSKLALPVALSAAIAALATAQATLYPRLRPEVLGRLRVRIAVRSSALVLLAGAMARPDLIGPLAAVPPVAGAVGGALASWMVARRRAA